MQTKKLKIIPLGGLGEFGMNCLALRWEDDIIVIDAGLMFPESELLGVDIVVPDISYLVENKAHVRAIILTHGHQDHIGGLPWLLSELKVPVYATEFTLAYVEGNLEENQLLDETELVEITPKEKFTIGPFTIEPIRVTHSLVDCVALAIETPVGVVIHTGDFKIDLSPLDDKPFDLHTFAEYGRRGVLCLLQDSTNVERSGYTTPVTVSISGDTLTGSGSNNCQWLLNGIPITGATTSVYIAQSSGTYTLQITDTNGCMATSSPVLIAGISNVLPENSITIFPNPSSTAWQLTISAELMGSTAQIFDATGRLVFQSPIRNPQSAINIPNAASGVYELRITSNNYSVVRKLIKM